MQPYTIWTYCDYDGQNDDFSDGKISSKLFHDIAVQVIKHKEAFIDIKQLKALISQCKGAKIKDIMMSI